MVLINLITPETRGPFFDPDATGLMRYVPRRAWWPVIPVLILGAPVLASVFAVDALTRRETTPAR